MDTLEKQLKIVNENLPPITKEISDRADILYNILNARDYTFDIKMERIYAFLDYFDEYFRAGTSCVNGCSYCCHMNVQLTSLEAEYITIKTGIKHAPDVSLSMGHASPCPFLINGKCHIYTARPLVCRFLYAFGDPENCQAGNTQIQYGHEGGNFGNMIFRNLIGWIHAQTNYVGGHVADIRDFFPHIR